MHYSFSASMYLIVTLLISYVSDFEFLVFNVFIINIQTHFHCGTFRLHPMYSIVNDKGGRIVFV